MKPKVLYAVEYYDHSYADSEDLAKPILCRDVGYFVAEKATSTGVPYLVFAAGLDADGEFNRPFNVTLKWTVLKVSVVRERK